jgi:tetratricopeptide (TPR) repeat protein
MRDVEMTETYLDPNEESDEQSEVDSLYVQASAEAQGGSYHLSAKTLTRCIDTAQRYGIPVHFSFYGLRGIANYKIGESAQALDDTNIAIEIIDEQIEPDDIIARLYYQRGMILLNIGDTGAANSDFACAKVYDPEGLFDPRGH